jgi:hypothetical protein
LGETSAAVNMAKSKSLWLVAGAYAGMCEERLVKEFEASLPEKPGR